MNMLFGPSRNAKCVDIDKKYVQDVTKILLGV